jgi:hypothetical protein
MQKGGVLIKTNPEEAINFFIENCSKINWLRETANSASGVIFECILKERVASPYEMIRSTDFKSPVKKILIKFVGIRPEVRGEYDDDVWTVPFKTVSPALGIKNLEKEETFTKEINVQTDIFLKTISYLNPLCPAPIYASIKKDKANAIEFMSKLKIPDEYGLFSNATNRLITVIIEKIKDGVIPYLGVLGMEIADGYETFYDFYSRGSMRDDIRSYENMIRLKNLELALKTGYSQGDFHTGNMLVNPSIEGYYAGIPGNALIIDFGYANKIPSEKLQEIKQLVSENKFVEALKIFNTLVRSDNRPLGENPEVYGWLSYNYDNKEDKPIELVNPEEIEAENVKLLALKQAEETATDERIAFYNSDSHSGERNKYPLLPLSNAVKNSLFEGMLSGGKKRRKTRSRKNSKKGTNKYKKQKKSKTRRRLS